MWAIDNKPFMIEVGTFGSIPRFGCAPDYVYRVNRVERNAGAVKFIDPNLVRFTQPQNPARGRLPIEFRKPNEIPFDGRAWRTLWEHRSEIPKIWWDICYHPVLGFSQFFLDGVEIFNPHGEYCFAYLRLYKGQVYWGYTPCEYFWSGIAQSAIIMRHSRAVYGLT